jgi:hypothetical protein
MLGHVARVARTLARSRDENGALDRIPDLNQLPDDRSSGTGQCPTEGGMSPPSRLSGARPWWLKVTSRGPIGVATDNRPLMV